jgi:hypothetical protein
VLKILDSFLRLQLYYHSFHALKTRAVSRANTALVIMPGFDELR